jgi:hypothetical protein
MVVWIVLCPESRGAARQSRYRRLAEATDWRRYGAGYATRHWVSRLNQAIRVPLEQANPKLVAKIMEFREDGIGMKKIAREVDVSSRTVWRLLQGTAGARRHKARP